MEGPPRRLTLLPLLGAVLAVFVLGGLLTVQIGKVRQLEGEVRARQQQVALLEGQTQDLLSQVAGLQKERDTVAGRAASLQQELGAAKKEGEEARQHGTALEAQVRQIETERDDVKSQAAATGKALEAAQAQLQRFERDSAEWAEDAKRLHNRLAMVTRNYEEAKTKLSQLEARPAPTTSAISVVGPAPSAATPSAAFAATSAIPGTIELPPIIVRKGQAGISTPLQGRVIEVNEPHNFLVIDQGQEAGVSLGMAFDILRGASTVGRATVVRVRPKLAACDIVRVRTPGPLLIGDLAVQHAP